MPTPDDARDPREPRHDDPPAEPGSFTPPVLDTEEAAEAFVSGVLLDPDREHPVVVVSTFRASDACWFDAAALAAELRGRATVAQLVTGPASWAFSSALPGRFDVFGGAFRLYHPNLTPDADPYAHPLFLPRGDHDALRLRDRLMAQLGCGVDRPQANTRATTARAASGASEEAWSRVGEHYRVGDCVLGRVQSVVPFGAFVDLLPGASGLLHLSEIDYSFVDDPGDFLEVGQRVKVEILSLDVAAQRCELSLKRAYLRDPLPGIGLSDTDDPFVDDVDELPPEERPAEAPGSPTDAVERLRHQLEESEAERRDIAAKLGEVRRELRSVKDRNAYLERELTGGQDPSASPEAFLLAVRVLHARTIGEGTRLDAPLKRMRVGREFLERLRAQLSAVSIEKVLEVCMQVACGQAHEINAREVHQLRDGPAGAPSRRRARDGAQAWRCSLQDHTASARRLHWWSGTDARGEWIEFAHVGIHDDMSIPE